jgi:phosphoacetylglucosamine mutase
VTTDDETRVTSPPALQPQLDALAARFGSGRCFVRPSGTEDVVRVYAEAGSQSDADQLAILTAQATWQLAGGTGAMPESY